MDNTDGAGDPERSQLDVCELPTLGLRGGKDTSEEVSESVSSSKLLRCNDKPEDIRPPSSMGCELVH
jgi:hypothetical protein